MDFRVEFYVSENGASPVRQFLDELKNSDGSGCTIGRRESDNEKDQLRSVP